MVDSQSSTASFLPNFCGARVVFVVIVLAELLAIALTLVQPSFAIQPWRELGLFSLFIQWVALSCVAALCLCGRYFRRCSDLWATLLSYGLILVVSLVISEFAWWVLGDSRSEEARLIFQEHGHFLGRNMVITAIVSALALRYLYLQHQYREQIRSESEARFQALQSRIRPHFLFNCMNTIASLTRQDPEVAESIVEDLSDLFRATLQDAQSTSTLTDELEICRKYLRIEQQRLGERLRIEWQIGSLPEDLILPALILQPLVENAIYHGVEHLEDGGTIRIDGSDDGDRMRIAITNPLPPPGRSVAGRQGNRLAQENVRQRLAAHFDEPGLLKVEENTGRYRVTVTIPRRPAA